jgi:hypothetical protein
MAPELLLRFARNVTSQCGEDGVLEHIFDRLAVKKGFCVEFGAWDGKTLSNSYNLIWNHGWNGILLEADAGKHRELCATFSQRKDVRCLRQFVGFRGHDSLEAILERCNAPKDFDLLSIDIDGCDYHVWNCLQSFRPKVVVVEFNPSIPNDLEFIQPADPAVNEGTSVLSFQKLAQTKGYRLVCCTDWNAFFVLEELAEKLGAQQPLEVLRAERTYQTQIFQCFDGTLKIVGCKRLLWHDLPIEEERLQVLPKFLRRFEGHRGRGISSRVRNALLTIYRRARAD